MSENTTTTRTPEEVCVAMARDLVSKGKLPWIKGTGYRLPMAKICQATGLNYSQAYLAIYLEFMPAAERIKVDGRTEPALAGDIKEARVAQGQSWGYIMARTGLTLGRVTKLFKLASGYEHTGLRIGRGGRFAADRADLYQGADRKDLGSEILPGKRSEAKPTVKRVLPAVTARQAAQGVKPKPTKAVVRKAQKANPKAPAKA